VAWTDDDEKFDHRENKQPYHTFLSRRAPVALPASSRIGMYEDTGRPTRVLAPVHLIPVSRKSRSGSEAGTESGRKRRGYGWDAKRREEAEVRHES